jgi:hypothetical protein
VTAGKKAPKASSSSPSGKTASTRRTKKKRYEEQGKRVQELEEQIARDMPARFNEYLDFFQKKVAILTPDLKEAIEEIAAFEHSRLVEAACCEVRRYVEDDDAEPLPAKHVGRALRELGAVDEPTAKNRIEIFAFFHEAPQSEVLKRLSAGAKYEKWAKGAHEHLTALRTGSKTKDTFANSNSVSNALPKPLAILEALKLAEAVTILAGGRKKRRGNYLRGFAHIVFNGWAPWSSAKPSGPAT